MTSAWGPERWAIDISLLLNAVFGKDRFPVDVPLVAKEYTAQKYPDDPVSLVIGRPLQGFDGALYCALRTARRDGEFFTTAPSRLRAESTSRSRTSSATT
jgi:hypothetical protein